MAVTTIAFLVLLGGTPAEHIIAMPSMSECHRAAEGVSSFQCLTADEFDALVRPPVGGERRHCAKRSGKCDERSRKF